MWIVGVPPGATRGRTGGCGQTQFVGLAAGAPAAAKSVASSAERAARFFTNQVNLVARLGRQRRLSRSATTLFEQSTATAATGAWTRSDCAPSESKVSLIVKSSVFPSLVAAALSRLSKESPTRS